MRFFVLSRATRWHLLSSSRFLIRREDALSVISSSFAVADMVVVVPLDEGCFLGDGHVHVHVHVLVLYPYEMKMIKTHGYSKLSRSKLHSETCGVDASKGLLCTL